MQQTFISHWCHILQVSYSPALHRLHSRAHWQIERNGRTHSGSSDSDTITRTHFCQPKQISQPRLMSIGQGWIVLPQERGVPKITWPGLAPWDKDAYSFTKERQQNDELYHIMWQRNWGEAIAWWNILWAADSVLEDFFGLQVEDSFHFATAVLRGLACTLCRSPLAFAASCHWDIWPGMFYSSGSYVPGNPSEPRQTKLTSDNLEIQIEPTLKCSIDWDIFNFVGLFV